MVPYLTLLIIAYFVPQYSAIKILKEYEPGVIFRLGRVIGANPLGLILLIPGSIHKMAPGGLARRGHGGPRAGRFHAGQRDHQGERRPVFPRYPPQ